MDYIVYKTNYLDIMPGSIALAFFLDIICLDALQISPNYNGLIIVVVYFSINSPKF